jgi:hypothetical protein
VSSYPVVITLALIPLAVIPVVHFSPPVLLKKIPPLVILVISAGFIVLVVVIPYSSHLTDWFATLDSIKALLEKASSRQLGMILPFSSTISAAR